MDLSADNPFIVRWCGQLPMHDMHQPWADLHLVCLGFGPHQAAERRAAPGKPDDLKKLRAMLTDWHDRKQSE